jgi:hypothetical protein
MQAYSDHGATATATATAMPCHSCRAPPRHAAFMWREVWRWLTAVNHTPPTMPHIFFTLSRGTTRRCFPMRREKRGEWTGLRYVLTEGLGQSLRADKNRAAEVSCCPLLAARYLCLLRSKVSTECTYTENEPRKANRPSYSFCLNALCLALQDTT